MIEVYGCGIDIEELARFDRHIGDDDRSLMEDVCTRRELDNVPGDRRLSLALRFSCKEAFFKTYSSSWTHSGISWKDIELLFEGPGHDRYRVQLSGHAEKILNENNAVVGEILLDYTEEFVMFQVVLLQKPSRPAV